MRGFLGDEIIEQIQNAIQRINQNFILITTSSVKTDGRDLENDTKVHVASVCLEDACHRFNHTRAAIFEAMACKKWYDDQITRIILILRNNDSWVKALDYRNCWVHEKPPIIAGLGIENDRKSRISADGKGKRITFGGGSPHKYTIDELTSILKNALGALAVAINDLLEMVLKDRRVKGETFDF